MKYSAISTATLMFCLVAMSHQAKADTTSIDCNPAGPLTFLSSSGIRIEVDGENGGCNASGDRYSFGNVIGAVRVFPGLPDLTGSQGEELLFDTPLEFQRVFSPLSVTRLFIGKFVTRRGFTVIMTGTTRASQPGTGFTINEFLVYEPGSQPLWDPAFYREWNRDWNVAMPTVISGTVEEASGLPIANVRVTLFRCRARDGLVGSVVTGLDGAFSFDLEEDGYYQFRLTPPAGFTTPPDRTGPGLRVFSNGFTTCIDYRAPLSDRPFALGARPASRAIRFDLPREE